MAKKHEKNKKSAKGGKASKAAAAVIWQNEPEEHDYPAALSYLSLLATDAVGEETVNGLREAPVTHFKAKDILRAARLPLLPVDNAHVKSDLAKVASGKALSPVLVIRGDAATGVPAQIADGYHRVCASYHTDENTDVPLRIADLATPTTTRTTRSTPAKKAAARTTVARTTPRKSTAKKTAAKKTAPKKAS